MSGLTVGQLDKRPVCQWLNQYKRETTMSEVDKRNRLDEAVFSYRVNQEEKVFLFWQGRQVKILKGQEAQKFLRRMEGLADKEAQLVMAKVTGNFKRGNER